MKTRRFRIGLVLNPFAGMGGPVALKGTDGADILARARELGAVSQVASRVAACFGAIEADADLYEVVTVAGAMGEAVCQACGIGCEVVYTPAQATTTGDDTRRAVVACQAQQVDLLLFCGGDGTARDVADVVVGNQAVLGIPCGVKMHSGVFANNPAAAARVLTDMIHGRLVSVMRGEVRDIDEASFREGVVRTQYYGEMWVPAELRYLQQVKSGGHEVEALVLQDIAADIIEGMTAGETYFIGSGSTTAAINELLDLPSTLLGVDVVRDQQLMQADATAAELMGFAEAGPCHIVVTAIGGQGHLFGRGNQQLSAEVIRAVGIDQIIVIATKSKLEALQGKPLLVDTGDSALDATLAGSIRVTTGYEDAVLYPVSA